MRVIGSSSRGLCIYSVPGRHLSYRGLAARPHTSAEALHPFFAHWHRYGFNNHSPSGTLLVLPLLFALLRDAMWLRAGV